MTQLSRVLVFMCVCFASPVTAEYDETAGQRTVVWRDIPIRISMGVGVEKVLSFPEDVQWGLPGALMGVVTGESAAGQVFLTSSLPFEMERFRFRGIDSNRFYLLDVTASDTGRLDRLIVQLPEPAAEISENSAPTPSSGIPELTRYALQTVYSPERLITEPSDVSKVRIGSTSIVSNLVMGHRVEARPVGQWRNEQGHYAIALELVNLERTPVTLDPRWIRHNEEWVSLGMINDTLRPSGVRGDKSTVVVITLAPWKEVSTWLR